jgi:hypothetical protein
MKVLHTIRDTPPNPQGLCALSINNDNCFLAYPGSNQIGEVQIFDTINLVSFKIVHYISFFLWDLRNSETKNMKFEFLHRSAETHKIERYAKDNWEIYSDHIFFGCSSPDFSEKQIFWKSKMREWSEILHTDLHQMEH